MPLLVGYFFGIKKATEGYSFRGKIYKNDERCSDLEFHGLKHVLGFEDFVKLLFGEEFVLENQFVNATTGFAGLFCDFGTLFVANNRVEHGDDADAVLNELAAAFFVGDDAFDAEFAESVKAFFEQMDAFEQGVGDDGFHDVQFELAVVAGEGDAHIVADDFVANLVHHFGNNGVDFAGHDRGTGLTFRKMDFVETATRTRREETEVVAHFVDFES